MYLASYLISQGQSAKIIDIARTRQDKASTIKENREFEPN
jgi:hypothetical protein